MKTVIVKRGIPLCRVISGNAKPLLAAMRVEDPSAMWRQSWLPMHARQKEFVTFYDWDTGEFPFGLMSRVIRRAKKKGVRLIVRGDPFPTLSEEGLHEDMLFGVSMSGIYSFQMEAVRALCRQGHGWAWCATNAGKATMIAALAKQVNDTLRGETVVVVPGTSLVFQLSKDLQQFLGKGITVGAIGGGSCLIGRVTITTAQSLAKACVPRPSEKYKEIAALLKRAKCLIIDEGHKSSAATWMKILETATAGLRYGFSGTVLAGGDKDAVKNFTLRAHLGPIVARVTNRELMDAGVSAEAIVACVTDPRPCTVDCTAPVWLYEYDSRGRPVLDDSGQPLKTRRDGTVVWREELDALGEDEIYNDWVARTAQECAAKGFKPMILTTSLEQIKLLTRLCERRGLKAFVAVGATDARVRLAAVKKFTADDKSVLLASSVFDEGINAAAIGALILAGGGKTERRLLQRIGRAVRRKKGGLNAVLVIDMLPTSGRLHAMHCVQRVKVCVEEKLRILDVPDLEAFYERMGAGWQGVLGKKTYDKLMSRQQA